MKKITSALISIYHKDKLDIIARKLHECGIKIYSTGGTYDFIRKLGIDAITVESLTTYPSILGGRVKTLHPKVFGGILYRRDNSEDTKQVKHYDIPEIDLVVVDLYPFEETVKNSLDEEEIIEKIDIGGISLIRAAAKNYKDVLIVPSSDDYDDFLEILQRGNGSTTIEERKLFAAKAFNVSSHYDTAIFNYFNKTAKIKSFKQSFLNPTVLRYGENPHQEGFYYGALNDVFEQLHGKEISYNNLVDLDAAINLINEFDDTTFAVLKHNNACGIAIRPTLTQAWTDALAADPVSAFGGVLICNRTIDLVTAEEIDKLFFELIFAPAYEKKALELLKSKKNRIILQKKSTSFSVRQFKSILNGVLEQEKDLKTESVGDMEQVTVKAPTEKEAIDLVFANKVVKHTKSNTIVLVKNEQLIASGVGQTSRVDALKQAIRKAGEFNFDLTGAVMASDAFFPFADSVEIAHKAGITAIIQPGGSIRDKDSIEYCDQNNLSMLFTGTRHFKH